MNRLLHEWDELTIWPACIMGNDRDEFSYQSGGSVLEMRSDLGSEMGSDIGSDMDEGLPAAIGLDPYMDASLQRAQGTTQREGKTLLGKARLF